MVSYTGVQQIIMVCVGRGIISIDPCCSPPTPEFHLPGLGPLGPGRWVYLPHADEEGVDEVPWGVGVQCALVLLHLLGYEVLQAQQFLECLMLWSRQVVHHRVEHFVELRVGRDERMKDSFSGQDPVGVGPGQDKKDTKIQAPVRCLGI